MSAVTLDSIRKAVEAKYASYDIEYAEGKVVRLLNAIRLPKDKRQTLLDLQDKLRADDADQAALLADAIRAVADSKTGADALLKLVEGDLATLVEIFNEYGKVTQVGEASASHE
jgi:hypothetical protein